jgi:N-acetylneuraminate synthase
MPSFSLENISIGRDTFPFIIAEMSGNHKQSLERALEIVEAAAEAGVQGMKLQTYTADTLTLDLEDGDFFIEDKDNLWRGRSLYNLYQEAYTPWEWHEPIFQRARELGLIAFSTPFDETAVEFLEDLEVPCYKIASFENADIPLIRKVASTGKPMFISTGMATLAELKETVETARENGCKNIVLLKCTSSYPASPENANIRTIPHMREVFGCEVGLSDHTLGSAVAVASVALGATVIEKHITLSRTDGGVDSSFSMEPHEMKRMVEEIRQAWQSLGKVNYEPTENEKTSMRFRRSLYICRDVTAGELLTKDNVRSIRPGFGLHPRFFDEVLGKRTTRDIKRGSRLEWDMIE